MCKVLIVDDENAILRMLSMALEIEGFAVTSAHSAMEATALLAGGHTFDIVVTDLQMETPAAGFNVVRAANKAVPRPYVIILTAFPVPHDEWKEAGADALYLKGMDTWTLPRQLKGIQERHVA